MSAFDQIRNVYFGRSRLPSHMRPGSRRRLLLVSLAPAAIIVVAAINSALLIAYHRQELLGSPLIGEQAPLLWRRMYGVSSGLLDLSSVAVALLFAAGIGVWTRSEGFWALVVASSLAGIALALGAFIVGSSIVLDQWDAIYDVYADRWATLAHAVGYMSIGYFFLAYRGASAPPEEDEPSPPS